MKIQDFPASASAMPADSESNAESKVESNALLPRKARLWIEWHGQLACEVMVALVCAFGITGWLSGVCLVTASEYGFEPRMDTNGRKSSASADRIYSCSFASISGSKKMQDSYLRISS